MKTTFNIQQPLLSCPQVGLLLQDEEGRNKIEKRLRIALGHGAHKGVL